MADRVRSIVGVAAQKPKSKKLPIIIGIIAAAVIAAIIIVVLTMSNRGSDMESIYKKASKQYESIGYSKEYDALVLKYEGNDILLGKEIDAINSVSEEDSFRIMIDDVREEITGEFPFMTLNELDCSELELIDLNFTVHKRDVNLIEFKKLKKLTANADTADLYLMEWLEEMTLVYTDAYNYINYNNLVEFESLAKLTVMLAGTEPYESDNEYALHEMPKLKSFSIIKVEKTEAEVSEDDTDSEETETETTEAETEDPAATAEILSEEKVNIAVSLAIASKVPQIEEINGSADYDPAKDLTEEEKAGFDEKYMEKYCEMIFEKFRAGEYKSGGTKAAGKTAVYVDRLNEDIHSSFSNEANAEYSAFAADMFTNNPEECERLIIVYSDSEIVGYYTNGGAGSATKTTVTELNLAEGKVVSTKVVATTQPSSVIFGVGGASGSFEPLKAKEYVMELLGE